MTLKYSIKSELAKKSPNESRKIKKQIIDTTGISKSKLSNLLNANQDATDTLSITHAQLIAKILNIELHQITNTNDTEQTDR